MADSAVNILNKVDLIREKSKTNGKTQVKSTRKVYSQPLISVIVPVFREEKILAKTLSAYTEKLRQKYHIELIISDGGSQDRTLEISREMADIVVEHNEDRRQTIAEGRNKGAERANGDILVFINGDTVPANPEWFFEFISRLDDDNSEFKNYPAFACAVNVDPSEKLIKDTVFYTLHNLYVRLLNKFGLGMGRGECQIVRREIFQKVGGYNAELTAGEDFDLFRRIAKIGKIGFAKDIVVLESPRRFRKFGYLRIISSWIINSLSVMFLNRSVSKEWEAVR